MFINLKYTLLNVRNKRYACILIIHMQKSFVAAHVLLNFWYVLNATEIFSIKKFPFLIKKIPIIEKDTILMMYCQHRDFALFIICFAVFHIQHQYSVSHNTKPTYTCFRTKTIHVEGRLEGINSFERYYSQFLSRVCKRTVYIKKVWVSDDAEGLNL